MALMIGARLGIPVDALRFFGVYGPRQALTNPYTGVGAIFSRALLDGHRPTVYEDGEQVRDFIHVSDVVAACMKAIQTHDGPSRVLNIGTGVPTSVVTLARMLAQAIPGAGHRAPEITGTARHGDIRACYADTRLARSLLGWEARVPLVEGVMELAAWAAEQRERMAV
jgi:dTDP-L-rhamnose 4-epimerase